MYGTWGNSNGGNVGLREDTPAEFNYSGDTAHESNVLMMSKKKRCWKK